LLEAGDYAQAAELISREQLAFEDRTRRLAITASEAALTDLPTIDIATVLTLRTAVHDGVISADDVRTPKNARAFHATLRRALPHKAWFDSRVLLTVPIGPDKAVAWVGHKDYAGDWRTLIFALMANMRIELDREEGVWRLSVLPMVRASAGEHDAIGATAPPGTPFETRRVLLNRLLGLTQLARQQAAWKPIEASGSRFQ
jgi:hypothetical protein